MSDNNLELKKLVYLYFLSYVKTQPKLAILAVNAFRNDTQDPSPLIRALAVRTMGCINVKDEENQVRGADVVQTVFRVLVEGSWRSSP